MSTPSHEPIITAAAAVGLTPDRLTECDDGEGPEAVAYFFGSDVLPDGSHSRRARVSVDADGDVFGFLWTDGGAYACKSTTLPEIMSEVAAWLKEGTR